VTGVQTCALPISTSNITKVQKDSKDEMSELEKLMIEEMKNF